jgi:hypothetical protein
VTRSQRLPPENENGRDADFDGENLLASVRHGEADIDRGYQDEADLDPGRCVSLGVLRTRIVGTTLHHELLGRRHTEIVHLAAVTARLFPIDVIVASINAVDSQTGKVPRHLV